MMKLLAVAPRYLLSEEPVPQSASLVTSPSSRPASRERPASGDVDHGPPETGPFGIVEDAFDLIDGVSSLESTPVGSASLPEGNPQPKPMCSAMNVRPEYFAVTDEDLGDLTRDYRDGREHSARIGKFEKEHPYLW